MKNIIAPTPQIVATTKCKQCGHVLFIWERKYFILEPENCPSCGAYKPWKKEIKIKFKDPWDPRVY
ncbi:hypothetical protein AGMMS50276_00100 [Synergistales bacterium]|nr:hypothetical protein AGMMS50276_00100 [Synergistales bacterium]